jgi:hypothetical protein
MVQQVLMAQMAVQAAVGLIVMLLELQHKQVRAELVMETQVVLALAAVLTVVAVAVVLAVSVVTETLQQLLAMVALVLTLGHLGYP